MTETITASEFSRLSDMVSNENYTSFYGSLHEIGSNVAGAMIPGPAGQGTFGQYSHTHVASVIGEEEFQRRRPEISLRIAEGLLDEIRTTVRPDGSYSLPKDEDLLAREIEVFTEDLNLPTEAYPGHDMIAVTGLIVDGALDKNAVTSVVGGFLKAAGVITSGIVDSVQVSINVDMGIVVGPNGVSASPRLVAHGGFYPGVFTYQGEVFNNSDLIEHDGVNYVRSKAHGLIPVGVTDAKAFAIFEAIKGGYVEETDVLPSNEEIVASVTNAAQVAGSVARNVVVAIGAGFAGLQDILSGGDDDDDDDNDDDDDSGSETQTGTSTGGGLTGGIGTTPSTDGSPGYRDEPRGTATDPDGDGYGTGRGEIGFTGSGAQPILLDLVGNGIQVTELSQSTVFMDAGDDGLKHRTAWAGRGDGVLFFDVGNDGLIEETREYVFTEWDPTARSDFEALRARFDSNNDGKLTSDDALFSQFKVMVTKPDGSQEVRTLAGINGPGNAGITSIDLTGDTTHIRLPDGSVITGQSSFTMNGVQMTAADVTLMAEAQGYEVRATWMINGAGNRVTTHTARDSAGDMVFRIQSEVTPGGAVTTNRYDDNGDGQYDRTQRITIAVDRNKSMGLVIAA